MGAKHGDGVLTVNRCMGDIAMSKRMWKGRYHLLGVDNNDQYETPVHVFDYYNGRYHFYRDVCATKQNAKVRRYFTPEINALTQNWVGPCWMNPPYGGLRKWVKYAHEQSLMGATVVGLVPAWCGDSWFHEYVVPFADVELFVKRLKFNGADSKGFAAHFSNMVCVWPWYASIDSDGVGPSIRVSTRF